MLDRVNDEGAAIACTYLGTFGNSCHDRLGNLPSNDQEGSPHEASFEMKDALYCQGENFLLNSHPFLDDVGSLFDRARDKLSPCFGCNERTDDGGSRASAKGP